MRLIFALLLFSTLAFASTTLLTDNSTGNQACRSVFNACKDAGLKGKAVFQCARDLASGQKTDKVSFEPANVTQQCKDNFVKWEKNKNPNK